MAAKMVATHGPLVPDRHRLSMKLKCSILARRYINWGLRKYKSQPLTSATSNSVGRFLLSMKWEWAVLSAFQSNWLVRVSFIMLAQIPHQQSRKKCKVAFVAAYEKSKRSGYAYKAFFAARLLKFLFLFRGDPDAALFFRLFVIQSIYGD